MPNPKNLCNQNLVFGYNKMKISIIIVIIFQSCLTLTAQETIEIDTNSVFFNYYNLVNQADKSQLNKDFVLADSLYKLAFSSVDRPFKHDYSSAFSNSMRYNEEQALVYLKQGINLGIKQKYLKQINGFDYLSSSDKKACFRGCRSVKINRNDSLYAVVSRMVDDDQRKARAFWTNWLSWEKQVKIMDKIDRPNALQLLAICEKYDWPGFSILGENTTDKYTVEDISLLILHFNKEELIKLQPYMVNAVENGEMYPYHLARVIDYLYMGQTTDSADYEILEIKQVYGTMHSNNEIIPYGDISTVNANRKLIGLEPIEEYAKKRGLTLPNRKSVVYRKKIY